MCIIIYSPDGHIPKSHLERSLEHNSDGWGVMVWDGKQALVEKGMKPAAFWAKWAIRPKGPVVFHARITSHGYTNLANCHPFEVPGHNVWMAHNGIIHKHAKKGAKKSDTRRFIDDLVTDLPKDFLDNDAIRFMMEDYIGHSKLVFMSGVTGEVHIIGESRGHWHKNRWYSNHSYQPTKPKLLPNAPGVFVPFEPRPSGELKPLGDAPVMVERKSIYRCADADECTLEDLYDENEI